MKIHLFLDHTALLIKDGREVITIEPACGGVLEIEGVKYPVKNGGLAPYDPEIIGYAKVIFTTDEGVRYVGLNTHMKDGVPFTAPDFTKGYVSVLIRMDGMAREIERLTQELLDLRAQIEPDSLGFINVGGNEHENE